MTVTSDYDPMLAKVAAWGPDRATALRRLDAALADTMVLGVTTNVSFLRGLLADPDVQACCWDTGLVERIAGRADREMSGAGAPDISRNFMNSEAEALAAAALARALALEPAGAVVDPWAIPDGWRPGERAWTKFRRPMVPGRTLSPRSGYAGWHLPGPRSRSGTETRCECAELRPALPPAQRQVGRRPRN